MSLEDTIPPDCKAATDRFAEIRSSIVPPDAFYFLCVLKPEAGTGMSIVTNVNQEVLPDILRSMVEHAETKRMPTYKTVRRPRPGNS